MREEILKKWEERGINTTYIRECLKMAEEIREYHEFRKDISEDKLRRKIRKIYLERLKGLEKGIELLKKDPSFPEDIKEEAINRTIFRMKLYELIMPPSLERRIPEVEEEKRLYVETSYNTPFTLIYDYLKEVVGRPTYGKEKTLPKEYLDDLFKLFQEIAPDQFVCVSPTALNQRIIWAHRYKDILSWVKARIERKNRAGV